MRTRDKVEALFDEGLTGKEIARMLGLSPATISYHKERLGYTMRRECATRYDWNAVQAYYDEGHTRRECQDQFGFSHNSWTEAVLRGDIIQHRYPMPFDKLLAADTPRNRSHIKLRILAAGLKENRCEDCGIARWHKRPLSLCLHHVNGDRHDNRLLIWGRKCRQGFADVGCVLTTCRGPRVAGAAVSGDRRGRGRCSSSPK